MHYIAGVNEFHGIIIKMCSLHNKLSDKYHSMEECVTDL